MAKMVNLLEEKITCVSMVVYVNISIVLMVFAKDQKTPVSKI